MQPVFLPTFRRLFDRATDRPARRAIEHASRVLPLVGRPFGDSFNIMDVAFYEAAKESADFWLRNMASAKSFISATDLLTHAIASTKRNGMFLEFGVASGQSITHIAKQTKNQVFGFDSFEGLPEDWRTGFQKGAFAGPLPLVPPNVTLVKGWFSDTLPVFLEEHNEPVSFLHVDCDLYSSTKCIFDLLHRQIQRGCVIVFDEYFNYPGWQQHEHRAFSELTATKLFKYHYEAFVPAHQQVCVIIE